MLSQLTTIIFCSKAFCNLGNGFFHWLVIDRKESRTQTSEDPKRKVNENVENEIMVKVTASKNRKITRVSQEDDIKVVKEEEEDMNVNEKRGYLTHSICKLSICSLHSWLYYPFKSNIYMG